MLTMGNISANSVEKREILPIFKPLPSRLGMVARLAARTPTMFSGLCYISSPPSEIQLKITSRFEDRDFEEDVL